MDTRKRVGDVLIEAGVITQQQLEQAIVHQAENKKRIGKTLVELGFATEKQIAEALAHTLSIPFINCNEYNLDEKIKSLVPQTMIEKKVIMPLEVKNNTLLLAMADPLDWETLDSLAFSTGMKIIPAITYETNLLEAILKHYGTLENIVDMIKKIPGDQKTELPKTTEENEKEADTASLRRKSETPTVVKLVTTLVSDAVKARASEIHIEPTETDVSVRFKIDGVLNDILRIPKILQHPVTLRIKTISNMDIANQKISQDGNSSMEIGKKEIDLQISTTPSVYGENIIIQLFDKTSNLALHEGAGTPGIEEVQKRDILTKEMVCVYLGVPKSTLSTLLKNSSDFPKKQIGRHVVFSRKAVEQWVMKGEQQS